MDCDINVILAIFNSQILSSAWADAIRLHLRVVAWALVDILVAEVSSGAFFEGAFFDLEGKQDRLAIVSPM